MKQCLRSSQIKHKQDENKCNANYTHAAKMQNKNKMADKWKMKNQSAKKINKQEK